MANRIQNQVANVARERQQQEVLTEVRNRVLEKERDAHYKYVRISNGLSKLTLLCKMDENGNLLPSEVKRINRLKKTLGIT